MKPEPKTVVDYWSIVRIIGHLDSLLVCASCQLDLFKDLVHNQLHVSPNSQDDMFLVHGTNTRSNLARNDNLCKIGIRQTWKFVYSNSVVL